MFRIVRTDVLAPTVTRFAIEAPFIARKRKAGKPTRKSVVGQA